MRNLQKQMQDDGVQCWSMKSTPLDEGAVAREREREAEVTEAVARERETVAEGLATVAEGLATVAEGSATVVEGLATVAEGSARVEMVETTVETTAAEREMMPTRGFRLRRYGHDTFLQFSPAFHTALGYGRYAVSVTSSVSERFRTQSQKRQSALSPKHRRAPPSASKAPS